MIMVSLDSAEEDTAYHSSISSWFVLLTEPLSVKWRPVPEIPLTVIALDPW